jgi:LacI family transcriptional regulator
VVAPFTSYGSFMERLTGVMAAAERDRYEIVLYDQQAAALRHHLVDSLPLSRKLDGLILMSIPISDRFAERLLEDKLPTVLLEFTRTELPSVGIDDFLGGRLVANYLIQKGHLRYGFVGEASVPEHAPDFVKTPSELRLSGFRSGLADAQLELADENVKLVPNSVSSAREVSLDLLHSSVGPIAVFADSDVRAVGVLQAARERGLQVPHDVAVVGFDDSEFAAYVQLSTVRQPLYESGRIALRLIKDALEGDSGPVAQLIRLPVELVPRATS